MDISIGELSRRAGVKIPTIRYYEGAGLIPLATRTGGKQRRYQEADVARLAFIRHARALGLEVGSIRELLLLSLEGERPSGETEAIVERQMAEVERRIDHLVALREELRRMFSASKRGRAGARIAVETLVECVTSHEVLPTRDAG